MSCKISILDKYPKYEANIGIEVHIQLNTKSKIFCGCANKILREPNQNICQICAGYPGSLPALNKKVVEDALLLGLSTNSTINSESGFSRKHYFYPDLPKNYQITQGDIPICQDGYVTIRLSNNIEKRINIIRIHMEEDAGKNIHSEEINRSYIDINRAGAPLLEIVSYPEMSNSFEAKEYLKALRVLILYLGISSANMEDGAFRADTNISVKIKGAKKLGVKCELKNINSFKYIADAIDYELERQIKILEAGGKVTQETRLWDAKFKKTVLMRSKEDTSDYRYFLEPDLPLVVINDEWLSRIKKRIPELPEDKLKRLIKDTGISLYEAKILIEDKFLADYFEKSYGIYKNKSVINWVIRDVIAYLKEKKISINELKVDPKKLASIVKLLEEGSINNRSAKLIFEEVALTGEDPVSVVERKGLKQINSEEELKKIVQKVIDAHPEEVKKFLAGKDRMLGFFIGASIKETKGKANPRIVEKLVLAILAKK